MAEIGLFEGRRVQLLDGEIIEMPATKRPPAVALARRVDAPAGQAYGLVGETIVEFVGEAGGR